tara:strand:+ start:3764 stop:4174 length:411 start_codon:yes stop_codon:yes gene_type:complete
MADIIRLKAHVKEHKVWKMLKEEGVKPFSPDWIIWNKENKLEFVEVKDKEKFEAGSNFPYDGQGLDYHQFKNYMECYHKFGIRTRFICFDEEEKCIYYSYLDVLDKTPKNEKIYLPSKIIVFAYKNFKKGDWNGKE